MASIEFKTIKEFGKDKEIVNQYDKYVKHINSQYSVVPWADIAILHLFSNDIDDTISAFLKMTNIIKPHIVCINFVLDNKVREQNIKEDIRKYISYYDIYTELNTQNDDVLLFGLKIEW